MSRRVYLDHNATSPLHPEVARALRELAEAPPANPSSIHTEGRRARALVEHARETVARLLGVSAGEVVFTSGGSEAVSAAVYGVCHRAPGNRRRLVVSAVEHSSALDAVAAARRWGFSVDTVAPDAHGRVPAERFISALGDDVGLAVLQWVNNETGVVQPVEEVGAACRRRGIPLLVDAVQAAGKLDLRPWDVGVDLVAASAHKLGGPQGAGALVVRHGIHLAPLIHGGAQERRRRGGTEAVPAIHGFGVAARLWLEQGRAWSRRCLQLRARLESALRDVFPEVRIHGSRHVRAANTSNFAVPGVAGETLVVALDVAGFSVSTGSACSAGSVKPSHVLQAMGCTEEEARSAVRVSFGWNNTPEEVDALVAALQEAVGRIRAQPSLS